MFQTLTLPSSNSALHFSSPSSPPNTQSTHLPYISSSRRPPVFSVQCRSAVQEFAEASSSWKHRRASLYEVLRVKRSASTAEIKMAYRSLAKLYHPDASPSAYSDSEDGGSDSVDFLAIHNAYETLSDPTARALYDVSLGLGVNGGGVRLTSPSFGLDSVVGRRRSPFCPTRRWETDQCW